MDVVGVSAIEELAFEINDILSLLHAAKYPAGN